ncbi:MAG: site-2 protease family protein [Thermoplasmata archaeon HGW-Thermoplasmata-1]|nr:MAG: site-2 protease family protein [Thermoplasmata archaeon HGW-Thermoplasmata-1]
MKEFDYFRPFEPVNLDSMRPEVERYFQVYDARTDGNVAVFFIYMDESGLEENFDKLRKAFYAKNLIPMLRTEGGEQLLLVLPKPKVRGKPAWVNVALLIATVITTTLAGSLYWISNVAGNFDIAAGQVYLQMIMPSNLGWGFLSFAFPLMLIIGLHEFSHYYIAKRHGIAASLPFFIPVPPVFAINLGTFGAVIGMRDPMPDRKSLLDVGIAGPLMSFFVSIPVIIVGLLLWRANPVFAPVVPEGELSHTFTIMSPLLFMLLQLLVKVPDGSLMHPTVFAGWVGLLVTAINLLPAGQLDGGHIARALLGDRQRYASFFVVAAMLFLGLIGIPGLMQPYSGWLIMGLIVLLLGMRHPPPLNDITPLDSRRKWLGVLAVAIFIVSFVPIPMSG